MRICEHLAESLHLFIIVCVQVEELKETVKEEFMPWVSQYLVMKRVSIEPNFHSLYSNFLDTLKNPEFVKMVLNETYRNIKVSLLVFTVFVLSMNVSIVYLMRGFDI